MKGSNLNVRSNIYIRRGPLERDFDFHGKVLNREAIKELLYFGSLNKDRHLSDFQKEILSKGSACSLNKEEIPYGLVKNSDGKMKWECRCEKIDCERFDECRPDFPIEDRRRLKKTKTIEKEEEISNLAKLRSVEYIVEDKTLKHEPIVEPFPIEEDIEIEETILGKEDLIEEIETIELDKGEIVEQDLIVKASIEDKIFVNAGPGTGKTHTLLDRIKYITIEEELIDPDELMVLCFSRAAIGEINNRLSQNVSQDENLYKLNILDIRTFDSFATSLIKFLEPDMDLMYSGYDDRIELAIKLIEENSDVLKNFKHIIIDEIQDLVGVRARLVKTILEISDCGFTLFGDTCQSIYNYQVKDKPEEMDTNTFYNWILNKYIDEIKSYRFNKNFRQKERLAKISGEIRDSILLDSPEKQKEKIMNKIKTFRHLGRNYNIRDEIEDLEYDNISFLCRSNGQALKVSNQLSQQGIEHKLMKESNFKILDRWIGECLNYGGEILSYKEFDEICKSILKIDEDEIQRRWDSLKEVEEGDSSKLSINELSRNLSYKKHIYENLCANQENDILVSTIHRAKGREFDKVILLDDNLLNINESNDLIDENKIYYVALTRPKEDLYRLSLKNRNKIKKVNIKGGKSRWYETFWNRNKKKEMLNSIEVGKERDIDTISFVSDKFLVPDSNPELNQEYILNNVSTNDRVTLILAEKDGMAIGYDIYHEGTKIGRMSNNFLNEVYIILNKIYRVHTMDSKYFPPAITDIYVDEVCTYVLENEGIIEQVNPYISRGIWNGITLTGFGKRELDIF
ncbi:UvrD-helicase domain-containing protein [Anaerosalibacter bizertensis]|uniref:UvrD-helicase domain-containing protein n=1 Tax=Anaerosalibacter bizertensis TaxID=932217 RepID=UPI003514CB93